MKSRSERSAAFAEHARAHIVICAVPVCPSDNEPATWQGVYIWIKGEAAGRIYLHLC